MLPHPLHTILSQLFLLTGCLKALIQDRPARSSRFQGQGNFLVIVSTQKVAEERSIKMAFSWHIHHINRSHHIFIIVLSSDRFSRNWFYKKYNKMLKNGTIIWLSGLAITFSNGGGIKSLPWENVEHSHPTLFYLIHLTVFPMSGWP